MATDERARYQLYLEVERTLGAEAATTLMELLPPVGWADVATKRDLEHYAEIHRREHEALLAGVREEMRAVGERFEGALRSQLFKFVTFVTTLAGIALVIARLFA